jgi:hypothetical protein
VAVWLRVSVSDDAKWKRAGRRGLFPASGYVLGYMRARTCAGARGRRIRRAGLFAGGGRSAQLVHTRAPAGESARRNDRGQPATRPPASVAELGTCRVRRGPAGRRWCGPRPCLPVPPRVPGFGVGFITARFHSLAGNL